MIEIALSIAIVAFAMVAIMGVLPTGLNVQKDNREDTIISQDGPFFVDAIRNGITNLTDLTNNLVWLEAFTNNVLAYQRYSNLSSRQIIGYLSTPKYTGGTTNTIRARFLANSGSQALKAGNLKDLAFSYLFFSEVVPFTNFYAAAGPNTYTTNLSTNLHEIRVTLRWPVLGVAPNDTGYGNGKQVFRALVSGSLTNDNSTNGNLFFFEPGKFTPVY